MESEGNDGRLLYGRQEKRFELSAIHTCPEMKIKEVVKGFLRNGDTLLIYGEEVDAEWFIKVIDLILDQEHRNLKAAQKKGIDKALRRKAEGTGTYGRPCTKVPEDFEAQVRKRILGHQSLSMYRESIKLPASTFYKKVNQFKEEWNKER